MTHDLLLFLDRVDEPDADGHELWLGQVRDRTGGRYKQGGREHSAHRYMWELFRGPIPPGTRVTQFCGRIDCVALGHLHLVSRQRYPAREITHCKRGHERNDQNTLVRRDGRRQCRRCKW